MRAKPCLLGLHRPGQLSRRVYLPCHTFSPTALLHPPCTHAGKVDNVERGAIAIVGSIPQGLPGFTGGLWFPMTYLEFGLLLMPAILITAVDLLESTSIAR